jgi:hypothetical protein
MNATRVKNESGKANIKDVREKLQKRVESLRHAVPN